jgi:hypothetical protein
MGEGRVKREEGGEANLGAENSRAVERFDNGSGGRWRHWRGCDSCSGRDSPQIQGASPFTDFSQDTLNEHFDSSETTQLRLGERTKVEI